MTPVEDSMTTLADLHREGKIRSAGLSEVTEATVLRAHAVFPVSAVQNEYSLITRGGESERVMSACARIGALFVPYAPTGRGLLTGAYRRPEDFARGDFRTVLPRFQSGALEGNLRLTDALSELAKEFDATAVQLALAWILGLGAHVVPIPGTRRVERLIENLGALHLRLDADDLARVEAVVSLRAVQGARYPAALDRPLS
jgi:aryl-alcohol dehydrogenase-like predicted oxidoreductase